MTNTSYTKNSLVRELAFNVGITQKKARYVLEALQFIVYREARNEGITIPGICRLDVIRRKPRKMKNPQTGENILIAEHETLRVRVLKKARNEVTPAPEDLITVLPDESASAAKAADDFSQAVSFRCKKCGQEIEAPLSAAGVASECPACGAPITVPKESEPGTMHGAALPPPTAEMQPLPVAPTAPVPTPVPAPTFAAPAPKAEAPLPTLNAGSDGLGKNQTIRIDLAALGLDSSSGAKPPVQKRMLSFFCKNCRQEIEAPAEMAGTASECPSCGVSFEVPFFSDPGTLHGSDLDNKSSKEIKEIKSRTIRIEVPDDV